MTHLLKMLAALISTSDVMMMTVLVCLVSILDEDYSWPVFAPIQSSNRVRGSLNRGAMPQLMYKVQTGLEGL